MEKGFYCKDTHRLEEVDLSKRLEGNLRLIKDLGFNIEFHYQYPKPTNKSRVLSKYICRYGDWLTTIKDIFHPEDGGMLKLEQIECLLTGDVYRAYCDLRGEPIDKKRFSRIKKVMDIGYEENCERLFRVMKELEFEISRRYYYKMDLMPSNSLLEEGSAVINDGTYKLYLEVKEDTEGDVCISISNNKNWSNPSQSTKKTTGMLFPLEGLNVYHVLEYIDGLFNDIVNNRDFPIPLDLYEKGYNWNNKSLGVTSY